jgi:hypothetical protein
VGVVVVDLFEESLHLSSVFGHGGGEFGHLVVEEGVEGVSSGGDDKFHLGIVGSDVTDEGGSEGRDESGESGSLGGVELSLLSFSLGEVGIESGVGSGNILIDGLLFGGEESEESESVVGVFLPFGVDGFLIVELLPGGESGIDEGLKSSSGGLAGGFDVKISLSDGGFEFSNSLGNCGLEEDTFVGLEVISGLLGGGVGNLSGGSLVGDSLDHDGGLFLDEGLILVLEVSDLSHDSGIFTIVSSELVSLGVSKLPDELLDAPLDLNSEGIDFSFEGESVGIDGGNNSLLSGEELGSLGVGEGVHACVGSGFMSGESGFEGLSLGINGGLDGILFAIEDIELSLVLFWNTFHGPCAGTFNEPFFVVDVSDVDWVLSVGEGFHVGFDSDSLLESSVSGTGSSSP